MFEDELATRYMFAFISGTYIWHGIIAYIGSWYFNIPSPALACAGIDSKRPPVLQGTYFIVMAIFIGCGIYYDILLTKFLKKKNCAVEPGQAQLVPWKSGDQQYSLMVPISATIVAVVIFFLAGE